MIWSGGRIVADSEWRGPGPDDRVFAHGLGLFETMRTWNGRVPLLDRHRGRLLRSAARLGIAVDLDSLPGEPDAEALRVSAGFDGDCTLRLTVTGGRSSAEAGVAWMTAGPLPPPHPAGLSVVFAGDVVHRDDPLARHKTLNYWGKRLAHEQASAMGADEALLGSADGNVWEGTRANLFLVREGRLITPGLDGPVLPGVMRGLVIERAFDAGIEVLEAEITDRDLDAAEELFLTNAVRGIQPVRSTPAREYEAPGPLTSRLIQIVSRRLNLGGSER